MSHNTTSRVSRRAFLQTTGAGLLAAPLAPRRAAGQPLRVPDAPGRKLGYAIVGLGRLAINQILPAFAHCEKARPAALVSGDSEKARKLAARYGVPERNIYDYDSYDTLRDNPDVDIIYIVLPNGMHAEYTIRGARAGKHILVEKPMANTPADCDDMIRVCREAGRKLMVAYRLRYEPFNQAMIDLARGEALGSIKLVVADTGFNIGEPTQWRLTRELGGGGSLMDVGVYCLQAARYLTGEEPVELAGLTYSTPGDPRFGEVEEAVLFQLRFPGGALANCSCSYGHAGINRFRVVGTTGWAELEPAISYTGLRMRVGRGSVVEERLLPQVDHFARQMDHLADCVITGDEPLTPGEDGLQDVRLMMAIYESAGARQAKVLS